MQSLLIWYMPKLLAVTCMPQGACCLHRALEGRHVRASTSAALRHRPATTSLLQSAPRTGVDEGVVKLALTENWSPASKDIRLTGAPEALRAASSWEALWQKDSIAWSPVRRACEASNEGTRTARGWVGWRGREGSLWGGLMARVGGGHVPSAYSPLYCTRRQGGAK